jgi:hypothetical protein
MKYSIDEINIGDEVYFNSSKLQSNHDLYWKVKGKSENKLMIELKEMGKEEYWTIDFTEVRQLIQSGKNKKE